MNLFLRNISIGLLMLVLLIVLPPVPSIAEEAGLRITIKDHKFSPAELIVPCDQKIKLVVENQDPTQEEFESYDLDREEVVDGNGKITVFIGPLKPGRYEYFGDFNQDTAQGTIVAQ